MDNATDVIDREARRLQEVLTVLDPGAPVPTCPGWSAADLLGHVAEVHGFWAEVLASRATSDAQIEAIEAAKAPRPEDMESLAALRVLATATLVEQLSARQDDETAWSWMSSDQTVGFTRRMQLHEATMHRVDAELAAGLAVTEPEEEVSVLGIDHCVDVMWTAEHDWYSTQMQVRPVALLVLRENSGRSSSVELSRTEAGPDGATEGVVLARRAPERDLSPGSALMALPRVEASGSSLALHLWSWGRGSALGRLAEGPQEVVISGHPDAVATLEELLAHGLQ